MRGWASLYATSVSLGARDLMRYGYRREALRCVLIPLDPSRYLELPWALQTLGARAGERVLDLASPKLLAVQLARDGVRLTCVDELESEIATWRALAAGTLRADHTPRGKRVVPHLHQAALAGRRQGLQRRHVGGTGRQTERGDAGLSNALTAWFGPPRAE